MAYGRGGYGGGGGGGGGRGKFEPQPGSGTLFVKSDKRNQQAPDYDGYFIPDRDIRAGEKIKLVGWDKQGRGAPMITLKFGRERQDAPGYNDGGYQGQPQSGYQQPPQGGYGPGPGQYGGPPNNPSYGQGPQGGYRPPQGGQNPGAYQGGGYGGMPARTYQSPQGQPPAAGPGPGPGPTTSPIGLPPQAEDDLPF
jgi:hypothetical protein